MTEGMATTCEQCGHEQPVHGGAGGTCTVPGCGCTRYWERESFAGTLDLGEPPAPQIPDRDVV
jgi:hypothetical protein